MTIKDLIAKASCSNYTCFSKYINSQGFSAQDSIDEDNGMFYIFMSNKDFPTEDSVIKTKNTSTFIANEKGSVRTSIRTAISEYYESLISQLKVLEFKATHTKRIYDAVIVTYKSKLHPKIIIELQKDKLEKNNHTWTSYMFTIIKAS